MGKFAVFDQYCCLSQKWYDTSPQFLPITIAIMITSRKSRVPDWTMSLSTTLMTLKGGPKGPTI